MGVIFNHSEFIGMFYIIGVALFFFGISMGDVFVCGTKFCEINWIAKCIVKVVLRLHLCSCTFFFFAASASVY